MTDTRLKLAGSIEGTLLSGGLSLGAIGLFIILHNTYVKEVFTIEMAMNLSIKKKYTAQEIEQYIDELINHRDIEIMW